jgi:hypothetical protein
MNQYVSDRERYVQEQLKIWNEKYDIPFECKYELIKYFELQYQYDNTPDIHVKTKREILDMMSKLKMQLPRFKQKFNDVIYNKLLKAAIKQELVRVSQNERGIGKTTTLINFAKEFDLAVVVPLREIAKHLRTQFDYDKIFSVNDLKGRKLKRIVVDEGIDVYKLKELKHDKGFEIVTGFSIIRTL